MNQEIAEQMKLYFKAGERLDIDAFDAFYDTTFENIRMDIHGNILVITKEQFMNKFRQMKMLNQSFPPSTDPDDIKFLGTNEFGPYWSLLLKRVKDGLPVLYNFVWQKKVDTYNIIREFTVEQDLSHLLKLIQNNNA